MQGSLKAGALYTISELKDALRLAKLITLLQDDPAKAAENLIKAGIGEQRRAYTVGVTGYGGCGKSTFIDKLIPVLRSQGHTVIVLAIDPSSTLENNGGALLGDRTRMTGKAVDPGLFIRSLATRSGPGSITIALGEIIRASAYFADIVLVETAGSGQADTDICRFVDTLALVLAPIGDDITLMKSGQTEHAHLIAVNTRQEHADSERFLSYAQAVLGQDVLPDGWPRKIFRVDAMYNEGIEAFVNEGLLAHRDFLKSAKRQ